MKKELDDLIAEKTSIKHSWQEKRKEDEKEKIRKSIKKIGKIRLPKNQE